MNSKFFRLIDSCLQTVLPWECPACSQRCSADVFCSCGRLVKPARPAVQYLDWPNGVFSVQSLWEYTEEAAHFFYRIKYGGEREWLCRWMNTTLHQSLFQNLDIGTQILPVPGRRWAWIKRGFHPAEEIARHVARISGLTMSPPLLKRASFSRPQVGRSRADRKKNVHRQYRSVRPPDACTPILLVDDVLTTGATLTACARVLANAGCPQVEGWTLFRV